MRISKNIFTTLAIALLLSAGGTAIRAQQTPRLDSIQCFIAGFDVGTAFTASSTSSRSGSSLSAPATMHSLYKSPWLNFGVNGFYKWKSNWLVSVDADLWFGNDNLRDRTDRLASVYTSEGLVVGTNGTDAVVTAYNRGLALKGGVGYIFTLKPSVNPNSGILTRLSAGIMQQQTVFTLNEAEAPQLSDDVALLYDHQRRGFMLTESIGLWYMSNRANLVNFYIAFELSQVFSSSTRDYVIDNLSGLQGPDDGSYFDMLYTLKLCWMFPLKGKTIHEYYYF